MSHTANRRFPQVRQHGTEYLVWTWVGYSELVTSKTFTITEPVKLDFFANATNALNPPFFTLPDLLIGAGHIGKITGVTMGRRQMEHVGKIRF